MLRPGVTIGIAVTERGLVRGDGQAAGIGGFPTLNKSRYRHGDRVRKRAKTRPSGWSRGVHHPMAPAQLVQAWLKLESPTGGKIVKFTLAGQLPAEALLWTPLSGRRRPAQRNSHPPRSDLSGTRQQPPETVKRNLKLNPVSSQRPPPRSSGVATPHSPPIEIPSIRNRHPALCHSVRPDQPTTRHRLSLSR